MTLHAYFTRNDIATGYWTRDWKIARDSLDRMRRESFRRLDRDADYLSSRPLYRKGYFDPRSKSVRVRATNERGSPPASRVGEIIVPRTVRASSRRLARSNGDTVEAPTFSSSNGNNLNSRRDDEELFPRLILESDAYYYQTASPVALSPFPSLCDLYRSRGKGGRGAKRQERNL